MALQAIRKSQVDFATVSLTDRGRFISRESPSHSPRRSNWDHIKFFEGRAQFLFFPQTRGHSLDSGDAGSAPTAAVLNRVSKIREVAKCMFFIFCSITL